jgi:hypothetical protein
MAVEKQFTVGGTQVVDILLSSTTSKGALSVFVNNCPAGDGPPPHIHTMEDEFFLPLDGEFELFNGASWSPIPPTGVWAPRNHVHTWRNSGSTYGRLLGLATGDNFDVFLEKFGAMKLPEQMGEMIAMSASHGISYVLPDAPSEAAVMDEELAFA